MYIVPFPGLNQQPGNEANVYVRPSTAKQQNQKPGSKMSKKVLVAIVLPSQPNNEFLDARRTSVVFLKFLI